MDKQTLKEVLRGLGRDAIVADETADEEKNEPLSSVGGVPWAHASEVWPQFEGRFLVPILSVNTVELPYVPEHLAGIALLNVFADSEETLLDESKGSVVIRAYESLNGLQPLSAQQHLPERVKLSWRRVTDYPAHSHLSVGLIDEAALSIYKENQDELGEEFTNHSGIKIGGWAHLIQDVYFLAKGDPMFVLQIDMTDAYQYCDSGIGYLMKSNSKWFTHWETM